MTGTELAEVIAALEDHAEDLRIQITLQVEGARDRLAVTENLLDTFRDGQQRLFLVISP